MTAKVLAFRPRERIRLDAAPIGLIYRSMDTATAETVVSRALGEVGAAMTALRGRLSERQGPEPDPTLPRDLRRLRRMAEQLGMISLGLVAEDLRLCLDAQDGVARAAVAARFLRVADMTLASGKGAADGTM